MEVTQSSHQRFRVAVGEARFAALTITKATKATKTTKAKKATKPRSHEGHEARIL